MGEAAASDGANPSVAIRGHAVGRLHFALLERNAAQEIVQIWP